MTQIERESGLSTSTPNPLPRHCGRVSEYVMRHEEYEKAYSEAREVLYHRGRQVGAPRLGADSIRHCTVDGLLLNDRGVLKEAWGERLADEIHAALQGSSLAVIRYQQGNLFWLQYTAATRHNLKILGEQQMAALKWMLQR